MRLQIKDYTSYKAALSNGVVRLTNDTPEEVEGLLTSSLKVCFAVIMHNDDKVSLMHFHTTKTTIASVQTELDWLSGKGGSVGVSIVVNERFYQENPNHIQNAKRDMDCIIELLERNNVRNIIRRAANSGAVFIRRDTREIIDLPGRVEDLERMGFLGEVVPDSVLQVMINDLTRGPRVAASIQYDGCRWHKNSDISHTIYTNENIQEFYNVVMLNRSNPELCERILCDKIKDLPAMQELKGVAGNFNSELEYEHGIKHQGQAMFRYIQAKFIGMKDVFTYKVFTMNDQKRELIDSLGGEILPNKDRGMFVVRVDSKVLTKDVRSVLEIDRVRITDMDAVSMSVFLAPRLNGRVLGWRGEPDLSKENTVLITFPYTDLGHKQVARSLISEIIAEKNNGKNHGVNLR